MSACYNTSGCTHVAFLTDINLCYFKYGSSFYLWGLANVIVAMTTGNQVYTLHNDCEMVGNDLPNQPKTIDRNTCGTSCASKSECTHAVWRSNNCWMKYGSYTYAYLSNSYCMTSHSYTANTCI